MSANDINKLYAALPILLWPVLWWSLRQAEAWHAAHANPQDLYEITISGWGIARLRCVARGDAPSVLHMRAFEECTEDWCLDQLGHFAKMFARVNRVKLPDTCNFLTNYNQRTVLAQPPLEPG